MSVLASPPGASRVEAEITLVMDELRLGDARELHRVARGRIQDHHATLRTVGVLQHRRDVVAEVSSAETQRVVVSSGDAELVDDIKPCPGLNTKVLLGIA